VAAALVAGAGSARAEVIQLLDNTQVAGKILHYYEGVFQIETAGGNKVEVPRDKIKSITFQLPPPRPELSTPEKTFSRWNDAVAKGDVARIVDCYALMYQGLIAAQLSQSDEELKKMQREVEGTRFQVKGTKVNGDSATLKVQRSKGDDVMTAELHLVRENGEWKLTP
jgi:hypothetical protein